MAFNFDEIVIDRVYRAHKFDLNGKRIWTATQIKDPSLECGGETVYSTDAVGANIMGFDRSKTGSFTFSNAMMHMAMLADQLGSKKDVAGEENKLLMTCLEVLVVGDDGAKATLTHEPKQITDGVPFKYLDKVDANLVAQATYELGETADTQFSVTGKTITLPTGAGFKKGDRIIVKYQYESTEGIQIVNNADEHSEAGEFIIEAFCYNPCDQGNKKLLNIIFPNAKEDQAVTLTMTNELTHPVTINAMQEYCSTDKCLFRIEAVAA